MRHLLQLVPHCRRNHLVSLSTNPPAPWGRPTSGDSDFGLDSRGLESRLRIRKRARIRHWARSPGVPGFDPVLNRAKRRLSTGRAGQPSGSSLPTASAVLNNGRPARFQQQTTVPNVSDLARMQLTLLHEHGLHLLPLLAPLGRRCSYPPTRPVGRLGACGWQRSGMPLPSLATTRRFVRKSRRGMSDSTYATASSTTALNRLAMSLTS